MEQGIDKREYILCTVDRIEETKAVLKTDDGQILNWEKIKLPADVEEGSQIKLILVSEKTEAEEREKTVKAVLNEILKTD